MNNKIQLRCPRCSRTKKVQREPHDPKNATVAETLCPDCVDETMALEPGTDYFDNQGNPVDWWEAAEL